MEWCFCGLIIAASKVAFSIIWKFLKNEVEIHGPNRLKWVYDCSSFGIFLVVCDGLDICHI
jgi:hypothetical protein